jgi:hypothetical protein
LFSLAAVSTKVDIGNHYYIQGTFFHLCGFSKFAIACYLNFTRLLSNYEVLVNPVLSIDPYGLMKIKSGNCTIFSIYRFL